MAGFLSGLFGNSKPAEPETNNGLASNGAVSNGAASNPEAFFLDSDEAKSLGDIDYMRTAKTIKRTYAKYKSVDQGGMTTIKQVSATEETIAPAEKTAQTSTFSEPTSSFNGSNGSNGSTSRASTDTSMDLFRKMAKDVKKPY
jgi:hypothetical protein